MAQSVVSPEDVCQRCLKVDSSTVPRGHRGAGRPLCDKCWEEIKKKHDIPDPVQASPSRADRYNAGKPQFSVLPWYALLEVAKVAEMGSRKYAPNNWKKGFPASELEDSALRHYAAWKSGEDLDSESKLFHLAHWAWNVLVLLETIHNHPKMDDRFSKEELDEANHQIKIFETGVVFGKAFSSTSTLTDMRKELNKKAIMEAKDNFPVVLICSNEKCGKVFKCYDQAQLDTRNATLEPECWECSPREKENKVEDNS